MMFAAKIFNITACKPPQQPLKFSETPGCIVNTQVKDSIMKIKLPQELVGSNADFEH